MKIINSIIGVVIAFWHWLTGAFSQLAAKVDYGLTRVFVAIEDSRIKVLAYLEMKAQLRSVWSQEKGIAAQGAMVGLFVTGMLAFILYIVIANFWPSAQEVNTTIQANTATDAGTTTSKTFFSMGLWLIPVGIFVALFIILIAGMRGGGGGGGRYFRRGRR